MFSLQPWQWFTGLPVRRQLLLSLSLLVIVLLSTIGPFGILTHRSPNQLFPSAEDADLLNNQVWASLAATTCPSPDWRPDFTSSAAYSRSVEPLISQLQSRTGHMPESPGGKVIEERTLAQTPSYIVEWLRVSSRLPGISVSGYLARPRVLSKPAPVVIVLPGSGVPPHTVLGWRLEGDESEVSYPDPQPLSSVGRALVDAGYVVFVPWLDDEQGNYPGDDWEQRYSVKFPWFELSAWGATNRAYGRGNSFGILVPGIMGAIDFLSGRKDIVDGRAVLMGWGEGAYVAAVTAVFDNRVAAEVWLGPPVDRRKQLSDPVQLQNEAPFTMLSCTFGQAEMAAMIAPRPLLFSYSTADPTYTREAAFVSSDVYGHAEQIYQKLGSADRLSLIVSADQASATGALPAQWLSRTLDYSYIRAGTASDWPASPEYWLYPENTYAKQRLEVLEYLSSIGESVVVHANPDYGSVARFTQSMQPIREQVADTIVGHIPAQQPVVVLERKVVERKPDYVLEWVRYRARFLDIELGGFLAIPYRHSERLPAVLSFDGNYDQGWLYGLKPAPFVYLNAYGDALARSGYVVFSPYMPSYLADGWGAILGAKTGYDRNIWSYLVPLYMSGVDFLLSEPEVAPDRIVAFGISYAGVAAMLTASVDTRIGMLVHTNPFTSGSRGPLIVPANLHTPTIWGMELSGYTRILRDGLLMAPRPFIWENGLMDANQTQDFEMEEADRVESVYRALGLEDRFKLVRHTGGHEVRPDKTIPVLSTMLQTMNQRADSTR